MAEQLRLEGIEVPTRPLRLSPATILLGRVRLAECRAVLTEAEAKKRLAFGSVT